MGRFDLIEVTSWAGLTVYLLLTFTDYCSYLMYCFYIKTKVNLPKKQMTAYFGYSVYDFRFTCSQRLWLCDF